MTVDLLHSGHSVRAEAMVRRFAQGNQDIRFDQLMSVHEGPLRAAGYETRFSMFRRRRIHAQQFQATSEDRAPSRSGISS